MNRLAKLPLRHQILLGFFILQAVVLTSTLLVVDRVLARASVQDVSEHLRSSSAVARVLLGRRGEQLRANLRMLSTDFAFKKVLHTGDRATIDSVALNFARRLRADEVAVLAPDCSLLADTSRVANRGWKPAAVPGLRSACAGDETAFIAVRNRQPFQWVAVPVRAPDQIGVIAAGFAIDQSALAAIKSLTQSDMTVLTDGRMGASTLSSDTAAEASEKASSLPYDRPTLVPLTRGAFLMLRAALSPGIDLVVQRSWDEAVAPLLLLKRLLLMVGAAGLAATLLLGWGIAGQVSSSIQSLVDKLRRLNELQTKFFLTVAHDVRNPVATIRGYSDLLLEGANATFTLPQMCRVIANSCGVLSYLVGNLTDFAAIESGKLRMTFVPCDLNVLLQELEPRMRVTAESRKVTFHLEAPPGLPTIRADPDRLAQALQNLCTNAVHYTPAGGSVTLSARREGDVVALSVRDTGIGIKAENLSKIFERFFQAEDAVTMRGGGMGLGLTIVQEIAHAHGGDVAVASEHGRGSTFTLSLPLEAVGPLTPAGESGTLAA